MANNKCAIGWDFYRNLQKPEDSVEELVLPFYYTGPGNRKQTFQLGGKQLHLMAHLAGAEVGFSEVLEAVVNSASDRY